MPSRALRLVTAVLLYGMALAIDNGIGVRPPRGWRSWNNFGTGINQELIEAQYAALANRSRTVDGVPTSLLDLGYSSAGIDDGWQKCNSGPGGVGFHDAKGYPIVDTSKFPSMKAMTAKATSLGITPGWYANNCDCKETRPACAFTNGTATCFAGDVAATLAFGFRSLKIDSCGNQRNMSHYAQLFNRSGTAVMLENCHNGDPYHPIRVAGDRVDCPMNFFRSSGDIRPQFGSILDNLMTTSEFNAGLTGPGCWGYPDMLEVGVSAMPAAASGEGLNFLTPAETRTHFAAWCIVSSPLTLSHDLTNDTVVDAVWPVISNREALAVNEAWVGDAGVLVKMSDEMQKFDNCHWGFNQFCSHAASMVWKKELDHGRVAVLLMNNKNVSADVNITWAELPPDMHFRCPAAGCAVRDIHARKDLRVASGGGFTAKDVAPHDSTFVVVQQCVKQATYPFKCVD
jgi:alpha-galactosidase